MGTTFSIEKKQIMAAPPLEDSSLPAIASAVNAQQKRNTSLGQDDGLFIGYGFVDSCYPYFSQDLYGRTLEPAELLTCVLENDYLRAEFLPEYGGRMWSLFDKVSNKELLFKNSVLRVGNLATRNAWFSGGVEWNCGIVGHHPYTCSPMHTAAFRLGDGTPVLRMFQFERIRGAVYQIDAFLPEASRVLFCRVKIINPNADTIPMYWWSNIAAPEQPGARVITHAHAAYTDYATGSVHKAAVPGDGADVTYPENIPTSADYFWKVDDGARKFICQVDAEGFGLAQTSTRLLKGRKLFTWGQSRGGDRWQSYLTADGEAGRYLEIQAGLARTQYECLPMPTKTSWEWIETYGAISVDPQSAHGEWDAAIRETERRLDEIITGGDLEALLHDTRDTIGNHPADEPVLRADGFGALEVLRLEHCGVANPFSYLDFGEPGEAQKDWLKLMRRGYMGEHDTGAKPESWMCRPEWIALMEKAVHSADRFNWYTHLQLGVAYLYLNKAEQAERLLARSVELAPSCWGLYALSQAARIRGDDNAYSGLLCKAAEMNKYDASLSREAMKALVETGQHKSALRFASALPADIAGIGRIRLLWAVAHLNSGNIAEAEAILYDNGALIVPDYHESESSLTDLWFAVQKAKCAKENREYDEKSLIPPPEFDYRANVPG